MDATVEVELTTLTYGGDAMGRLPDGRAVFVPFGLPGERVRLRLVEEKRGHARAELVEVLQPSPRRIVPRCVHFSVCGGCHYQHLAYPDQLRVKKEIVREQLRRIGGIQDPPVSETVPSPGEYYYRNHVQFTLSPRGKLGYLAAGSNRVVEIRECHLPEAPLNEFWPQLDFDPDTPIDRASLRVGPGDDILLALESEDLTVPEMKIEADISVVHLSLGGRILLAGEDAQTLEVLGREFRVSAESFFQVNTAQAEALVRHLLDRLPLKAETDVLELYCGVGLFSAFIAPRVNTLTGVELSPSACEDFVVNLDEFDNVTLYQGAVEEVLGGLEVKPDLVLVDPPRAGIERRAMDTLLKAAPQVIAYVSCDPSTLARDAKRLLAGGYLLSEVTPFDLFPQTFHIEVVAVFNLSDQAH